VALLTTKLLHAFAVFIPSCYLHFIINLLGLSKKRLLVVLYAISTLFLAINFTPYFISGVEPKLHFRFYATAGRLYIFWIITYTFIACYGLYLLLKNFKPAITVKKYQIIYVLFASLIGFVGGATIYPLFYNIPLLPFGEYIIFLYPIIFTVAVLKHNLLDLNLVIRHTVVYSISVLLISLVYIITIFSLERIFRNVVGYQSLGLTLTTVVAIALLFTPIKNKVQSLVDKFYVTGAYQRLQKQLLESDKQKVVATLAAGLAHEIRNPLTAIKTFAEYLPDKFDDPKFRENFSRIVTTEVDKINSLVSQLLEFSKPLPLNITEANVHQLIDYTLGLLSAEMIRFSIKVDKSYAAESSSINADPNKLKHVFHNIIKNAIEAMPKGGTLQIHTFRVSEKLYIEVSDTGYGIKPKELKKIFNAFYTTKAHGTGLGLAIANSILADHGGNIIAKSTPGKGTTFTIIA